MTGTIELSQYVIDAIANAVVKKMQEPCEDCVSRKEVEKLVYRFLQKSTDENSAFYEHLLDLPPVIPQESKTRQFAEWVASEIFDDNWEYNKDAFAELACRKLEKLGIVRAKGDEWELVDSQERSK